MGHEIFAKLRMQPEIHNEKCLDSMDTHDAAASPLYFVRAIGLMDIERLEKRRIDSCLTSI